MPKFGKTSQERLLTTDRLLQLLFTEVVKHWDCSVISGHRGEEEQMAAYNKGTSKVKYPNSKHNQRPSKAVDVAPYPIDWEDTARFYMFVGFVRGVAYKLGIEVRCGADWDGDTQVKDQNFHDLAHFELLD